MWTTRIALAAFALLAAAPAQADVSWKLVATATANDDGTGNPSPNPYAPPLPATVGSLTVSDALFAKGSLSYQANYFEGEWLVLSGDKNFTLDLGRILPTARFLSALFHRW